MQLNLKGMRLIPLPKQKLPEHVFKDCLAYLLPFITDTHANGTSRNSVKSDIQFVLSHLLAWVGPTNMYEKCCILQELGISICWRRQGKDYGL